MSSYACSSLPASQTWRSSRYFDSPSYGCKRKTLSKSNAGACVTGKVFNPATGRCVLASGPTGRKILGISSVRTRTRASSAARSTPKKRSASRAPRATPAKRARTTKARSPARSPTRSPARSPARRTLRPRAGPTGMYYETRVRR